MNTAVHPTYLANMNNPMIVRLAQPQDAPALKSLYRQLVDDPNIRVDESSIRLTLEDDRTRLFVCDVDGIARATAAFFLCADIMYGGQPFAAVENVIVDLPYRGKGLGQRLLHQIEQFCLAKNCSKMMLLSSAARTDAHRFFERSGFRSDVKRGFVKYRRDFVSVDIRA